MMRDVLRRQNNTDNKTLRVCLVVLCMLLMTVILFSACGKSESGKEVTDAETLKGARIGVQTGTTGALYATDLEADGSKIFSYNTGADAVMSLKQNKVDCVIIDEEPAKKFAELNSDLKILDESFVDEDYAICLKKNDTELVKKINEALAVIEENGVLSKIKENYIGDNKGSYKYESPDDVDRSNGKLVMATSIDFMPYEYYEGETPVGIDIDMAKAITDVLGMELEITDMKFDSILSAVQSGKADIGVSGMTVTEDRLKNAAFSNPYIKSKQVIIVLGDEADNSSFISMEKIKNNFIRNDRWKYIVSGLEKTLIISFFAVLIGVVFGFLIAVIRFSCDMTGKFKIINMIFKCYITVIRGIPVVNQLLIIYYVVFADSDINSLIVAIFAFGINSSAYIAEIVRSGLCSIDKGQFEAGRSMGFSYMQTMRYFILPQAVKNILPALGNEFIVLVKETSIAGYIGICDLTRGGDIIRSQTFDAFLPLVSSALIYLTIVVVLTMLVNKLERRLKKDER